MLLGFGALLVIARLQVTETEHKLLLIGWTVFFYAALALQQGDARTARTVPITIQPYERVEPHTEDELLDVEPIPARRHPRGWNRVLAPEYDKKRI